MPGPPLPATLTATGLFSAGLARCRAGEPFADAISRADKALYQAKETGRDRIVLAQCDPPQRVEPTARHD